MSLASPLELSSALLAEIPYGAYLAWWKALPFVVIFIVWVQLLLWMDKDSMENRMPREQINAGQWCLLLIAMLAGLLLPMFVVALTAYVLLFAISVGGYLMWRKQVAGLDDIPDLLKRYIKNMFRSRKVKRFEKEEEVVAEGMITLMDKRGNALSVPAQDDPLRPAFEMAHRILLDPLYKGAERVIFASAGNRYATKFRVDGMDYPGMAVEPDVATATLDFLKTVAGLELEERRKHQVGKMRAKTALASHDIEVQTSGTRTGETLLMEVDRAKRYKQRATALGFIPQQRDIIAEVVATPGGVVIGAAPVGGGLTALLYGLILEHDAFVQHIITLERPQIERELEGVTQNDMLLGSDPAEEAKQLSWIADQVPDVFLVTAVEGREGARQLLRLAGDENKRVYLGMRAVDTADAFTKWRTLIGETKTAVGKLELIIVGRTLRKLCDACKIGYTPPEQALAKMGIPRGKVTELFRARTEPMLDPRGNPIPCSFCNQLGYKGRLGVFEVLRIDDAARKALMADAGPASLRAVLRSQKLPTLNEAALRAVVAGKTDLAEVQRVMTPASAAPPAGGPSGGARPTPKRPAPAA
jgi:type II secretory ATPase GspE/PulE/Tfp pilus assembly ATPase PilB-like protein